MTRDKLAEKIRPIFAELFALDERAVDEKLVLGDVADDALLDMTELQMGIEAALHKPHLFEDPDLETEAMVAWTIGQLFDFVAAHYNRTSIPESEEKE